MLLRVALNSQEIRADGYKMVTVIYKSPGKPGDFLLTDYIYWYKIPLHNEGKNNKA
jgi:hypothetical protein